MSEQAFNATLRPDIPVRPTDFNELNATMAIVDRDNVFKPENGESKLKAISEAICNILGIDMISVLSDVRSHRILQELAYLMIDIIDNSDQYAIQTLAALQQHADETGNTNYQPNVSLTERTQLAFFRNNIVMRSQNGIAESERQWFEANDGQLGEIVDLFVSYVGQLRQPNGTSDRSQDAIDTARLLSEVSTLSELQVASAEINYTNSRMGDYVALKEKEVGAVVDVAGQEYRLYADIAPRVDSSISIIAESFGADLRSVVATFQLAETENGPKQFAEQPKKIERIKEVISGTVNRLNSALNMILALAEPKEAQIIRARFLTEWAKQVLPLTRTFVLDIAKHEQVERLRIGATSGPQGTGKGTNFTAIQMASDVFYKAFQTIDWAGGSAVPLPESISNYALSYLDNSATVITGTGGMFYMPKDEYAEMFANMYNLNGAWTAIGELVPPEFTSVFSELMTALRIVEGARSIQYDLWPRSQEQMDHQQELVDDLRAQNVAVAHELLDLRLLTGEEITIVQADREGYALASEKLGIAMKNKLKLFNDYVAQIENAPSREYDVEMIVVERMATELKAELAGDERVAILFNEIDRAMDRMKGRNRTDDMPKMGFNRLASYEKDTHPGVVRADGIPMISTTRPPSEVAPDILTQSIAIDENIPNAVAVRAIYAETAGQIAEIVVAVNKEKGKEGEEVVNAEIQNRIIALVQPNLNNRIKEALEKAA